MGISGTPFIWIIDHRYENLPDFKILINKVSVSLFLDISAVL
jgi:hypothetical protein